MDDESSAVLNINNSLKQIEQDEADVSMETPTSSS